LPARLVGINSPSLRIRWEKMTTLKWDDLRHLLALAEEGSLSAAARKLDIEHATVARRIGSLEAQLGSRLVDRRGGRYGLTRDGRRAVEHARRMQDEALKLLRDGLSATAGLPTEVTATVPPTIASELVIPRLPAFRKAMSWVELRLAATSRNMSLTREADVALRLSRPDLPTLLVRRVGRIDYGLYGTAAYLRNRRAADFAFVGLERDLQEVAQQKWLDRLAEGRPTAFRSNDLVMQCAAVRAGLGLAALPIYLGEAQGFRRVPAERQVHRDVWLSYHRDLKSSPAIAAVAEFLVGCLPKARTAT